MLGDIVLIEHEWRDVGETLHKNDALTLLAGIWLQDESLVPGCHCFLELASLLRHNIGTRCKVERIAIQVAHPLVYKRALPLVLGSS